MPIGFWIARSFFIAGGTLALVGLVLWSLLPISLALPPYLFTAILALVYGMICWRKTAQLTAAKEAPRE